MTRQTLCHDYSDGIFTSLAIIQTQRRYQLVQVSQRESNGKVVLLRFLEVAPRIRLREALGDLQAYVGELRSADRQRVLREARTIVQLGDYVGLDTETTGLEDRDQIISWAVIGSDGGTLGRGLVKPTVPISESASQTHHIREEHLVDAPGFGEAWAAMEPLLTGQTVLIFGTDYDIRLLKQSGAAFGVPLKGLDESRCYCVSEAYAAFRGEPDKKPERRYRRHKLVAACAAQGIALDEAPDAAADARATVQLLQALALVADLELSGSEVGETVY